MRRIRILLLSLFILCLVQALVFAQLRKVRQVRRAEPPTFNAGLTSGVFFSDVFSELNGERPADFGSAPARAPTGGAPGAGAAPAGGGADGVFAWSKMISPTTIEDEIKGLKLKVDKAVTTPTKFAGRDYKLVRKYFSTLALMFAIAGEYDGDVRWKSDAPTARDVFGRTAGNAKVGTIQVYNEAKLRKQELEDLLGGSSLQANTNSEPAADWSAVADRGPLMQRLESAFQGKITPYTSSDSEFAANKAEVLQEAEIMAAIGEVLTREGMADAGDDDYDGFSKRMRDGALQIVEGVKLDSLDQVRKGASEITKSCSECHELYRG